MLRRSVRIPPDPVGSVLAIGASPDEVGQRAAIVVAKPDGIAAEPQFAANDLGRIQHATAVAAQALVHGIVDIAPVVLGEAFRRTETPVDLEGCGIEPHGARVGTTAEAKAVVESLLEHAQGRNLATRLRALGNGGRRDTLGSTELAGHATGGDAGDHRKIEIGFQVAHGTQGCRCQALSLAIQAEYDTFVHRPCEFLVDLGVVLLDPADLAVDAVHRLEVAFVVVVGDLDVHRSTQ